MVAVMVLLVAAAMYTATLSFPVAASEPLGPGFFPRLLAVLLVILGLSWAVRAIAWPSRAPAADRESIRRPAAVLLLLVGYVALLSQVGFVFATPAFVVAVVLVLGGRMLSAGLAAVGMTAVIYTLFQVGLNVHLPNGRIW